MSEKAGQVYPLTVFLHFPSLAESLCQTVNPNLLSFDPTALFASVPRGSTFAFKASNFYSG